MVENGNHVAVLRAADGTWVRRLTGPPGTLRNPFGVGVVPSTGEVLVSDWIRDQVVRFRSIDDDTVAGTLGTSQGDGPTQFDWPCGLAVLDGSHPLVLQEGPVVVVTDRYNNRLSLWRLGDGTVWKHLGSPDTLASTQPGQFTYPMAVAVTGAGALVVTDEHRVQVLTVDGAALCVLDPTAVVGVGRLGRKLFGVALYPGTDEILVTDCDNDRVVALSWSPAQECDARPFANQGAWFSYGVAVTKNGYVWMSDQSNHCLVVFR